MLCSEFVTHLNHDQNDEAYLELIHTYTGCDEVIVDEPDDAFEYEVRRREPSGAIGCSGYCCTIINPSN